MVQVQIVVCSAPDVQTTTAGSEVEVLVARPVRSRKSRTERNFALVVVRGLEGVFSELAFQVFLSQLVFEFTERWIDRDAFGENIHLSVDRHRRQRAVAIIVNVIDGRGENLLFEPLGYFGRRFRVLTPLDLQLKVMWGNAATLLVIARAFINQRVHPSNQMIGGEA